MPTKTDPLKSLERTVVALTKRVETLESERPGRKALPLVAPREQGVCAVNPERDSATCTDASIYRYQMGCHGDACRAKQHAAYMRRREVREAEAVKVKVRPRKATSRKAVPTTSKRVTKKTAAANGK
jgi:hypothetical protein